MAKLAGPQLFDVFRGSLIGAAEAVPGISGGTVALITGVYEKLIGGAGHLTSAARMAATDLPRGKGGARAAAEARKVDWGVVVPLLIGMAAALVLAAKLIAPLVKEHPQYSYAVFFGLVLASLWVPFSSSGRRWRPLDYLIGLAVAAGGFVLTGLPPAQVPTHPLIVAAAGAVAICALVLPGVSGSFLLLTLGLYEPTIEAVNERDFGHLGAFAVGCVVGLALFVKLLKWLLERYHHMTLVVMTGLMAGSLRALWPWQDDDRSLLAPSGDVGLTSALAAVGALVVVAVLVVEHRSKKRRENPPAGRGRHARVPAAPEASADYAADTRVR
jgi:putative membrane protein